MNEIHKISYTMPISDALLASLQPDDRPGHTEPPEQAELAAYRTWKKQFKPLRREGRRRGWFIDGGPEYGFEYQPPRGDWVYDDEESE